MISLRNRRATLLPSTLTFAVLCHAGLASAQTPQGWPFDDKDAASQQAPAPPVKSAVQLRLEELYRRDGRPLPDYMRTDASQNSGSQQAPQQQPAQLRYHSPAPGQVAAPQQTQVMQPAASQGSIPQQLSDYYASQGKTMPRPQSGWNSAEQPRQMTNGYSVQPAAQSPAPQPGFFERLWRKDAPTSQPQTSVQVSGYAPVAATTPAPSSQATPARYSSQPQPTPAPVAPSVVHSQPAPKRYVMNVELGESAPSESAAPSKNTRPTAPAQRAVASHAPQKALAPSTKDATASKPATALAKAPVAVSAPSAKPQAAADSASASGVATVRDETPPFDPKSESEADKRTGPYTGLKLQESDDAVTAPGPTKVTTANANEPANRPRQAPMPAVDVEPSAKPIAQPKVAAHAAAPTESQPKTQSAAPKMFVERHPATQLPPTIDDSAAQTHKIGERIGQHGMKGFCPVALREQRQLVDALPIYSVVYQSKRYYFSSAEAQARFEQAPQKYAPIAGGTDVVIRVNNDQVVNGTLDFAVWYKDRLFLFSSPESAEAFSLNPHPYASAYLSGK